MTRLLQDQCSSGDLALAVAGSGVEGSVSRSGTLLGGAVGKALAAVKDGWLDLPPQQVVASKCIISCHRFNPRVPAPLLKLRNLPSWHLARGWEL